MNQPRSNLRIMVIRQGFTRAKTSALDQQLRAIGFDRLTSHPNIETTLLALSQDRPEVILLHPQQQGAIAHLRQACEAAYLILFTSDDEAQHTAIDPAGPTGFARWPCPNWELRARIEAMAYRVQRERMLAEAPLQQRAAQLALLNDIGKKIAAVLDLESVLEQVVHLVQENFGFHHVALFLIDETRGKAVMKTSAGNFAGLYPINHALSLGQGMVGNAALLNKTLLANDVGLEPRYVNLYPEVISTLSELCVPIHLGEQVVGVLDAQSPLLNAFTPNDILVLETIADQAAVAIQNARLHAAVQQELAERARTEATLLKAEAEARQRLEFEMLVNEMSTRFISLHPGDVDRVIEAGLKRIAQSLGLERCVIGQLSSNQKQLIYTHTYSDQSPDLAKGLDIAEVTPGFLEKMLQQQPVLFPQAERDPSQEAVAESQQARQSLVQSVIALPIVVDGKVFGVLSAASRHSEQTWPPELVSRLRLVGEIFASALARKRSEEALRQSEERYRQLFEINQTIKLIVDPENNTIVDANQAAAEYYGYDLEKLKTISILEISDTLQAEVQTALRQAAAGERAYFNAHHRLANGELRDVEVYTGPVVLNGQTLLFSIVFDVTERHRAETERERLLAQVREIMNSVPEGVALLNWSGRVLTANPAAEAYLDLLAKPNTEQIITHLGDRLLIDLLTPPAAGMWHELIAGDRVFQATARSVAGQSTPEHWVLVIRDVTQEHQVQKQIQQQERLAAVGQLAAGIAHDFNNILSVILLYAEIVTSAPDLTPIQRERMQTIKQQADRASNLIQQVLDFSRRSVLERKPMDLLPFLKEQAKLLERTIPEIIRIRLGYKPGEYMVKADPTRLQQALLNLAVNARDAMPQGGELYIALSAIPTGDGIYCVTCGQVLRGDWLCLSLSDTGNGIPADILPHIFEPFFTTKPPGRGTGLGLAQVYGIVKQHEGHVDVQSHSGAGSTFRVFLPAHITPSLQTTHPGAGTLMMGDGQTILLVEDEAETRQALQEGLTLLNYQVHPVSDGVTALSFMARHPNEIALVLTDVVMPKMGGVALLSSMRRAGLNLPVVFISGHPLTDEVEKLYQDGQFWFIAKPASLKHLAQVIAQALLSEH